jgi:pyruvate dehydrogenase E2 component (dihydrolipoamide acetyltransferase)
MSKDFKLPDLGEGIHEAQIVKVMINQGDSVKEDQMVLEVETDKAAVELPVPFGGVISKLNVKVGDTVTVGAVLLSVDEAGSAAPAKSEAPRAPAPSPAASPARSAPVSQGGDGSGALIPGRSAAMPEPAVRTSGGPVPAAPAVRKMAREIGVDLHEVHGTGPGGRIVREDVERHQLSRSGGTASLPAVAPASRPSPAPAARPAGGAPEAGRPLPAVAIEALPDFTQWGPVRREALTQIRKAIARQMVRAYTIIPHVTHGDEVDVTDLEGFRREQGKIFEKQGAKLTLTAFVIKAVAGALRQFPQFNASYDDAAGEMVFKEYVHIGVAVDTPRGLTVPVIRDVDRKGLLAISQEMRELADKAREFKLDIAAMRGGSFTVTNVGALGGTMSTPMINYPEVAILGMGKLEEKPVVRNGEIVIRKILPLFLSFDHRVIDGADSARFIRAVMGFLENPLNLLLVS